MIIHKKSLLSICKISNINRFISYRNCSNKISPKLLIANRGEIACRIIKTARKLGQSTVVIYSDADSRSLHVRLADEAYHIGSSVSSDSYLNSSKIIELARSCGAHALHPGYGFLSENPEFVDLVLEAGLTFVGPPSEAMRAMGDKINSKRVARNAGCFVIPGFQGEIKSSAEAREKADAIGYPIMLKASAGGGGKGMRIVNNHLELEEAFRLCQAEAQSSFGDSRLLMEKYIQNPHHIEIQVLADNYGNVVAFPERECSIQRRNQKVIEESPSCLLQGHQGAAVRRAMQLQAIALCKATGYRSAGTVEMLCDDAMNFYFLEMNTRLQVEHPITELVSGEDLVEHMLNIAAGRQLPQHMLSYPDGCIPADGWAIECRVYAEDPKRGFVPCPGTLTTYKEPDGQIAEKNTIIRVDSGVCEGDTVTSYYDPMIAKLSVHAPTRGEAVLGMSEALDRYLIRGPRHNIAFLRAVMENKSFQAGKYGTSFISKEFPSPEGFQGVSLGEQGNNQIVAVAAAMHYVRSDLYHNIKTDEVVIQFQPTIGTRDGSTGTKSYRVSMCLDDSVPEDVTGGTGQQAGDLLGSKEGKDYGRDETGLLVTMSEICTDEKGYERALPEHRILVTSMDWRCEAALGELSLLERVAAGKSSDLSPEYIENKYAVQFWGQGQSGLSYHLTFRGWDVEVSVLSPLQYELNKYSLPLPDPELSPVLLSPMSGTVKNTHVKVGDIVEVGQVLVTIEAMKMQNVLKARRTGRVKQLLCGIGERVEADKAILEYED